MNNDGYIECIVTFIDILGFRSLLAEKNAKEVVRILSTLRDSVALDKRQMEDTQYKRRVEIISDAIVTVRDISLYGGGASNLFDELIYIRELQRICIMEGIALRGALTVGKIHVGSDWTGPLFGPALVEAYEMESQEVIYPRICVHEMVIERAISDSISNCDMTEELAREFTELLLTQDGSGLYFIDYLQADRDDQNYTADDLFEFMAAHKHIIDTGLNNKSPKILRKYRWLKKYHNRFLESGIADRSLDWFDEEIDVGKWRELAVR